MTGAVSNFTPCRFPARFVKRLPAKALFKWILPGSYDGDSFQIGAGRGGTIRKPGGASKQELFYIKKSLRIRAYCIFYCFKRYRFKKCI